MKYSEIKRRFANPGERCFYNRRFAIYNEFGVIAFAHANSAQEALDIAADADKLDSHLMTDEDYQEHEANGWDDGYMLLGNAGEPFASVYLGITEITKA